jgi:hypothetical protein
MSGINDAVLLLNLIKGGAVTYYNKCFGATGTANSGSETLLPSSDEWSYLCTYMSNLQAQDVDLLRTGIHDWQGTVVAMNDPARTAEKCLIIADAAAIYGIKVVLVLGGFSDSSTSAQGAGLFDENSALYTKFVKYAAQVADALKDSNVELLELLNEPDHVSVKWESLKKFISWETFILADVRAQQAQPGVPLGMGTAVDSSLYAMDWWGEISGQSQVIDSILKPCDVASVHTYIGDRGDYPRDVWMNQKVPAFKAAAKRVGRKFIVGETGLLYNGGTYDAGMDVALKDVPHCWMVRWWDPTKYTKLTTIPERPGQEAPTPPTSEEPTPDPPVVEEPEPPVVVEPEPDIPESPLEPPTVEPDPEPPPTGPQVRKLICMEFFKWLKGWFKR